MARNVGFQIESGIACRNALRPITTSAASDTGVRRVQLANHLHDDGVQLVRVGDVREQRLVFFLRCRPIDVVHLRIVEAVLHHAPRFLEDLAAFGGFIDFEAHGERNPARRGRR